MRHDPADSSSNAGELELRADGVFTAVVAVTAVAATDGGGMVIYVNPLVNVAELERLASELLNL